MKPARTVLLALCFAGYAGWGYWRGQFPGGFTRYGDDVPPTTRREDPTGFWIEFLFFAAVGVCFFLRAFEGK